MAQAKRCIQGECVGRDAWWGPLWLQQVVCFAILSTIYFYLWCGRPTKLRSVRRLRRCCSLVVRPVEDGAEEEEAEGDGMTETASCNNNSFCFLFQRSKSAARHVKSIASSGSRVSELLGSW